MTYAHIDIPTRSATGGPWGGWLRAVSARMAERRRQRLDRAAFRNLLHKDEWVLRDLGVTRHDVEQAAGLPLSRNAAEELRRLALANRLGGM
ncbi:hypothetical protein [Oceanicella sp. SM1341]|uniref:hypothetical protein n=1 Tax=Oceanicella sp. SM1341 TaxID=1548889 RepID=UPI000E47D3F5|nr:hypothetical protein [Oceanicella sp. SM1341]